VVSSAAAEADLAQLIIMDYYLHQATGASGLQIVDLRSAVEVVAVRGDRVITQEAPAIYLADSVAQADAIRAALDEDAAHVQAVNGLPAAAAVERAPVSDQEMYQQWHQRAALRSRSVDNTVASDEEMYSRLHALAARVAADGAAVSDQEMFQRLHVAPLSADVPYTPELR
jgi:hypothetical protein